MSFPCSETAAGDDSYIKLSRCVFKIILFEKQINKSYLYIHKRINKNQEQ